MPRLTGLKHDFEINSTSPNFDCSAFDKLNNIYNNIKGRNYLCQSIPEGGKKDVAKHWSPLGKPLPTAGIVFIVIGALSVVGALLFFYCVFWPRRKRRVALLAAEAEARNNIPLGGVPPRNSSDPPEYSRIGKPGEVPPEYAATHAVVPAVSESSLGDSERGVSRPSSPDVHRESPEVDGQQVTVLPLEFLSFLH